MRRFLRAPVRLVFGRPHGELRRVADHGQGMSLPRRHVPLAASPPPSPSPAPGRSRRSLAVAPSVSATASPGRNGCPGPGRRGRSAAAARPAASATAGRQLMVLELAQAQQQRPPGRDVLLGRVALQEHVRFDAHTGKAMDEVGAQTVQPGVRAVPEQGPEAVGPDPLALVQRPAPVVPVLQLEQEHGRMGLAPREVDRRSRGRPGSACPARPVPGSPPPGPWR